MYIAVIWYKKNWKPVSFVVAEYKHSGCILHCRPDKPKKKNIPSQRCHQQAIFNLLQASVSKQGSVQGHWDENIFYSQSNRAHFHKKDFALNLLLKARIFGIQIWESGVFT